jgi:hypothetical protein
MASPISGGSVSGKNLLLRNKIAGEYIGGLTTSRKLRWFGRRVDSVLI